MSTALEPQAGAGRSAPAPGGGTAMRVAGDWARRAPLLPALVFMIIVTQLPFVATLVISFMNWNAYYPDQIGFAGFDNYGAVFTDPDTLSAIWTTVIYTVSVVLRQPRARPRDRAAARPCVPRPRRRAHDDDHAVPDRAGRGLPGVEARALQPDYGLLNGLLSGLGSSAPTTPPQPDWISDSPADVDRGHADLAVDAVHDADPAGRPAEPSRWTSSRPPGSTAANPGRCSGT